MPLAHSRRATRWLLAATLAFLLLWLALPRLLGLAAERWLAIPGLTALHVDIETIGAGHASLREVRAAYRSAGGHALQMTLRDIKLDYSLAGLQIEHLDVASGELGIFPGQTPQPSPWIRFEWPHLPLGEAQVRDLQVVVHRAGPPVLEARGSFRLQQTPAQLLTEFRMDDGLLRMSAARPSVTGQGLDVHAEWLPSSGPVADARLHVGGDPVQQVARLVAEVPLPLLARLGHGLGIAVPLSAQSGKITLEAQADLGESAGTLRALSGEAEFSAGRLQVGGSLAMMLDGKLRFAWQPSEARLELQPGLRWQLTADGGAPLQISGQLGRTFAIRRSNGETVSEGELPFAVRSPQWGSWDGAALRAAVRENAGLADWGTADLQLRINGQVRQWQRGAIGGRDLRAAGVAALHWSGSGKLHGDLALKVAAGRLSWQGDFPLTVNESSWTLSARAAADANDDFWESLVVQGEASSPQLKAVRDSAPPLTLGPSRLQLLRFQPARRQGAKGELLLAADAIRFGDWPAPDLRARLLLDGSALRADGSLLLQGNEALAFAGAQELNRGCGEATLMMRQPLARLGKLLQPRPPVLAPLSLAAGEADGRLTMDWCARPKPIFNAKGRLQLRDAALGWDMARVEALQGTLQLDGLQPLRGRVSLVAQGGVLATGTPLSDLSVDLSLASSVLNVHALRVSLLGGSVHCAPLGLPWPPSEKTLPLEVRQIDLEQLLALLKVDGLSGSGRLSGVLPLAYGDGSVEIIDGQLSSPGAGTLKYAPGATLPDNPGLQVLRNFHFRQLGLHLWYGRDGAYRTQARLDGNNPDLYEGYPIRFGLNVNGALPGLFRSALFSGDFNRHILEQLQSGKLE